MSMSERIPSVYPNLKKGDRLFAVITYHTPNIFLGHYLPQPYFVLEVHIDQISGGSPSDIRYYFDTDFFLAPSRVFTDPDKAKNSLIEVFKEETKGVLTFDNVTLVSAQEYKEVAHKLKADRRNRVA